MSSKKEKKIEKDEIRKNSTGIDHDDNIGDNGLAPSTRVEHNFKPQRTDKVHGNDFIYGAFGPNSERRHKHFKCFFACQNPSIEITPRAKYPNWKVRPKITLMNYIYPCVWLLGESIYMDVTTILFQGMHKNKQWITYKTEGDGFQCDACDKSYTHQIYFRNHPSPENYLKLGMSPLHSRVLALIDYVQDKYHVCGMDNLCNSVTFYQACYIKGGGW